MSWQIIWSEFAENELDRIYEYYFESASPHVAKNIISGIIKAPNRLVKHPYLGQVEPKLSHLSTEYRYFLHKNYKIIYSINFNQCLIKIADVFDTWQNPAKIKRNRP